jgi:methylphosphotriester-DNA--protein-cysteine methyltransferase
VVSRIADHFQAAHLARVDVEPRAMHYIADVRAAAQRLRQSDVDILDAARDVGVMIAREHDSRCGHSRNLPTPRDALSGSARAACR